MKKQFDLPPSAMCQTDFIARYAEIYEHSPWLAARVWRQGIDETHNRIKNLHHAMVKTLSQASREEKLALIRAHPDLAGKAALRGEMTHASSAEQAGAGLDRLDKEELSRFIKLNTAYKDKFNFPFIMAVKNSNKFEILAGFEARIHNDPDVEFETALAEINKIALFRLGEL